MIYNWVGNVTGLNRTVNIGPAALLTTYPSEVTPQTFLPWLWSLQREICNLLTSFKGKPLRTSLEVHIDLNLVYPSPGPSPSVYQRCSQYRNIGTLKYHYQDGVKTSLHNKNAIVTGGSRGIGRGIANELASRGANIILTYNCSRSHADEVFTKILEYNVNCIAIEAKRYDPETPRAVIEAAVKRWGHIDIIVNNAGVREDYDFEDMTLEAWQQ